MMNDQAENKTTGEASGKVPQFSVGAALHEARERLGLSVADVANRIKFAPRQIEAMEADDFAHLPEMPFVRGFVRSYARLLGMEATPLLAALPQKHLPLSAATEDKSVEVPFPSVFTSRRSNIIWLAAGLLVALALIIFSRMHDTSNDSVQPVVQTNVETLELPATALDAASAPGMEVPPAEPVAATAEVTAPKLTAPARDVPVAMPPLKAQVQPAKNQMQLSKDQVQLDKDKQAAEKSAKDKQVKDVQEKVAKEKAAKDKKDRELAAKVATAATPKSAATSGNAASGLASMRLVFDRDSWVDVTDANGKILLSKMNHAGSLVRLSGAAPLSVVIGHASGVHLFYNGKEIDLAPNTSVEVARLVLE